MPKELEIVATFLENDIQGIPINWWLQQIDEVLDNLKEYNEFKGTLCAVQVKKDDFSVCMSCTTIRDFGVLLHSFLIWKNSYSISIIYLE
ncbi:hypothetical protein QUF99_08595 [Bacillus sp. DX4.1]|nr:hypothetical protein [Bacillus sp. DX4.1]MDM5187375.1 hypothetical protein [Bacillus sp. DX4.1]